MGIEYTLFNYKTKEMIDLGKGSWWVFKKNPEIFLYREEIENCMKDEWDFETQSLEMQDYWNQIINMIWDFVKDADPNMLDIIGDSDDSLYILKCHGFKYVNTRYKKDNSKDRMTFLNKHINNIRYNKNDSLSYLKTSTLNTNFLK